MWDEDGPHHLSRDVPWYLGGLMATAREMAWMYAPFVNSYKRYQLGLVGADRDRVEPRQPHVRVPDRRRAHGLPRGVPDPRRRREPVPGVRRHDRRAGCGASATRSSRRRCSSATRTRRRTCRACPRACTRRSRSSAELEVAREVFGDFVFEHLLNTAVQEQIIFDNLCVTDWELQRYFERG